LEFGSEVTQALVQFWRRKRVQEMGNLEYNHPMTKLRFLFYASAATLVFTMASVLAFALCAKKTSFAADQSTTPYVESVEGEKIIVIQGVNGNRLGTVGSHVEIGETIKTGLRSTVKVRYPDGSKLLIGVSTEMWVKE